MGKSKPKAPPAPDYVGAAKATAEGNLEAVKYQTEANRIDQTNPWGSLTYSQDANGKWSQNETLDPTLQAALNSQIELQKGRSDVANGLMGQVADSFSKPYVGPDRAAYTDAAGKVQTTPGLNTNEERFNGELPALYTNPNYFSGEGSGQDTSNLKSGAYTAGAQGLSQNAAEYLKNVGTVNQDAASATAGVNKTNQDIASALTGVNAVNQNVSSALTGVNAVNQDARTNLGNVSAVNQSAPQFDATTAGADLYARKAYDAQMALQAPQRALQQEALQNNLRLQGLSVTSEANQNAQLGQSLALAAQDNALAAGSYASGAEQARANYASQLAGIQSGNAAQNQAFSQGMDINAFNNAAQGQAYNQGANSFALNNAAQQQAYSQGANNFVQNNAAQNQAFNQGQTVFNNSNAAQNQAYAQGLGTMTANNTARNQVFQNGITSQGADLNALQVSNAARNTEFQQNLATQAANQQAEQQAMAARNQTYQNQLAGYGANQSAIGNANAARAAQFQAQNGAQGQAYAQALQNYGIDQTNSSADRTRALNEMNALLNGQQVQDPNYQNFAQQGYAPGADLLGAVTAKGQYDQSVYNAQMAAKSSSSGGLLGLAGSIGGAWAGSAAGGAALAAF